MHRQLMWILGCSCALRSYGKSYGKGPNDSNVKMLLICSLPPLKSPFHAGFQNTRSERNSYILNAHNSQEMKTLIQIYKEGKFFVAVDLITNVADQGLSEEEALANLKKGLEEHYQILLEMAPKGRKVSFLDIEVEKFAQAPGSFG